uniref:SDR family oxidoreductase n=1 Tax=Providencia stuartii TaxID=588 RepID=UPI0013CF7966
VYGTSRDPARHDLPWRMIALDVTDDASAAAAMQAVLAEQGRIDALVNNAGLVLAGAVEDTAIDEARRVLETNLLGTLRMARAALPAMRAQR